MTTPPKVIIETIAATGMTTTEAAEFFGVTTRWIRTLTKRFNEGGYPALEPKSTRPHTNPRTTPQATIDRILTLRDELTTRGTDAGAHTIRYHLEQEHTIPLPAASTIHRILHTHGRITPQPQKRPRSSWIRFQADQPNETWQLDYSDHTLTHHRRITVLTILDDHSRFVIACHAFPHATVTNVIDLFTQAGHHHGFPQSTLTDNGRAFTTSTNPNTTSRNGFEQLLLELGITRKNGKPYHPQTQGKVERFHHTLKMALAARPPADTLEEFNTTLNDIIDYYNHHRPHRALGRNTPATAYQALPKATPALLHGHPDHRLRVDKVGKTGKVTLRWKGQLRRLYVGRKYTRQPIVLVCIDDHVTAFNTTTGTQIGFYELNPDKLYHPNLLLTPKKKHNP